MRPNGYAQILTDSSHANRKPEEATITYPDELKAWVTVQAVIDSIGSVRNVRILQTSDTSYNKEAIEYTRAWHFKKLRDTTIIRRLGCGVNPVGILWETPGKPKKK